MSKTKKTYFPPRAVIVAIDTEDILNGIIVGSPSSEDKNKATVSDWTSIDEREEIEFD